MESYVVSARKYRPATFQMVVGQDNIVRTLKNAILNKHLAQAFLFTGPRGVGKTTCARIMAKTINCTNLTSEGEACNECSSCRSFNTSASFNIHELDAASNNSVEDIRNLVEQVRVPPQEGQYKIYIIDEVHMLSQAAFNAFLKTLEEPPAYAKFILATTERHKIIPTILSRCQIYNFKRISVEDISRHLAYVAESEGITAGSDALHIIAQKADGALRDALSLFDQMVTFSGNEITYQSVIENLNILDYDNFFQFTDFFIKGEYRHALLLLNEITGNGFDGQHIISGLSQHIRNLLIARDKATLTLLEMGEQLTRRYISQAEQSPEPFLAEALDMLTKAEFDYRQSNVKTLMLENVILQLSLILSHQQEHAELKKKIAEQDSMVSDVAPPKYQAGGQQINQAEKVAETTPSIRNLSIQERIQKLESRIVIQKNQEAFDEKMLELSWNDFCNSIEKEKINLHSILSNARLSLGKENQITLTTDGAMKAAEIEAEKMFILSYLRKALKNDEIGLDVVIEEKRESLSQASTKSDEKYQQILEQYPALGFFMETLNLQFE